MKNKNILTIIASGFLFVALFDGLPYGYFTFLRFVVCAVGIYLAHKIYEDHRESLWVWAFSGIAILFNPIFIIHLERNTWWVIDLVVGVFFILTLFLTSIKDGTLYLTKTKDHKENTDVGDSIEELYSEVSKDIIYLKIISPAYIQRKFKVDYVSAKKIMDILERREIIGPKDGAKPRKIL